MSDDSVKKCFAAMRTDGLGERLRAMINAMILAEHFGVDFKFTWEQRAGGGAQHHAVLSARQTFNSPFLSRHFLGIRSITAGYPVLEGRKLPADEIRRLLNSAAKGLRVNQEPISRLIDLRESSHLRSRYKWAFRRLRFTRHVQKAIDAAWTVPLPNRVVAVHLRAGDIVYGHFRFTSTATAKVVCYPVVKRLISDLIAQGKTPLLFGQDKIVCRMLADRFNIQLAAEVLPEDDALAAAMSEIVLMSRCEEIHAGSSGFSILASLIGVKDRQAPAAGWTAQQVIDCILSDDEIDNPASPLPDLQRAFAFYMIAYSGMGVVDDRIVISALGKALQFDPGNAFYGLHKANLEFVNGDPDSAEMTLNSLLAVVPADTPFEETLLYQAVRRAIVKRGLKERLALFPCLDTFTRHVTRERPCTSYVAGLAAYFGGNPEAAGTLAAQALAGDELNPQFLSLLDLCRRSRIDTNTGPAIPEASEVVKPNVPELKKPTPDKKIFLAQRTDGFGERLKAILNAMVMADVFGGDFRFSWSQNDKLEQHHHVIAAREDIFAAEFLDAFHLKDLERGKFHPLTEPRKSRKEFQAFLEAAPAGVQLSRLPLDKLLRPDVIPDLPARLGDAFWRIQFTPPLLQAIAQAREAPLPDGAVAVHLRAGDTIYGSYRFSNKAAHKALSYPAAKAMIADLIASGKAPLIFGQDDVTCRLLADQFGLKLAADMLPAGLDNVAIALFDIVLMSRCHEIYAAGSGFAAVASWIGGIPLHSSDRLRDPGKVVRTILADKDLDNPDIALPDLQRAFAFFMVVGANAPDIADSVLIANLAKALKYDPGNAFYSLRKAEIETRSGDLAAAEATLKTAVHTNLSLKDDTLRFVLNLDAHIDPTVGPLNLTDYLNRLPVLALNERPYMAYVAALAAEARGATDQARDLARRAATIEPQTLIFRQLAASLGVETVSDPAPKSSYLQRFSLSLHEALRIFRR